MKKTGKIQKIIDKSKQIHQPIQNISPILFSKIWNGIWNLVVLTPADLWYLFSFPRYCHLKLTRWRGKVQELRTLVVGFTNQTKRILGNNFVSSPKSWHCQIWTDPNPKHPHCQILLECTNFPQLIPLSRSMSCLQVNAKCQFLEGICYTAEAYVYKSGTVNYVALVRSPDV